MGGVEQSDILGIHDREHETRLVKFYEGLDDLPTMREAVNYGGFFDDLFGDINKAWKANERSIGEDNQILDGNGKPLPEPVPCRRGETKDSSNGSEDAGSGEVQTTMKTKLRGNQEIEVETTTDSDGNVSSTKTFRIEYAGVFSKRTRVEEKTQFFNNDQQPANNTTSKPKPALTTRTPEQKVIDTNLEEERLRLKKVWNNNDDHIKHYVQRQRELEVEIDQLNIRANQLKSKIKPTEEDKKAIKIFNDSIAQAEKDKGEFGNFIRDIQDKQNNVQASQAHVKECQEQAKRNRSNPTDIEDAIGLIPRDLGGGNTGYKPKLATKIIETPTQQPPVVDRPETPMQRNRRILGRG